MELQAITTFLDIGSKDLDTLNKNVMLARRVITALYEHKQYHKAETVPLYLKGYINRFKAEISEWMDDFMIRNPEIPQTATAGQYWDIMEEEAKTQHVKFVKRYRILSADMEKWTEKLAERLNSGPKS